MQLAAICTLCRKNVPLLSFELVGVKLTDFNNLWCGGHLPSCSCVAGSVLFL